MTNPKDEMTDTPQEQSAKELRDLAEAALFTAQRDVALAELSVKQHEARKAAAHALSAELGAESMRVQTEATLRTEKLALASNHHHHVYDFIEMVNDDSVETCLAQLAIWDRMDPECDMHIIMNSPGGSVISGAHLLDQLMLYSKRPWDTRQEGDKGWFPRGRHSTKITVRGVAASMGGVLLQAADERVMGPESFILIHEASVGAHGKIFEIKDQTKWLERWDERLSDLFVLRSNGKITKDEFNKQMSRRDWWCDSAEALELGFVDRLG